MKEFNVTGVCVSHKHYMVDIKEKLDKIVELIEKEKYFTINRARQFGKTTTFSQIYERLKEKNLIIRISFEGMGEKAFSIESEFINSFINLVSKRLKQNKVKNSIILNWEKNKDEIDKFEDLSEKITHLVESTEKEIILLVDEVDKSSNNQLFLHFLGMLRNKYLDREENLDSTFKSVILAGVYDVKNLKLKFRADEEEKYNSPWNIATNFEVDMSFNPKEISSMLKEYEKDFRTNMNIAEISSEIYNYTEGYPYLVTKICKVIHEKLDKHWNLKGIEDAVKIILDEKNTLFDDLIKNLENHKEIYNTIYSIVLGGKRLLYNSDAYEKEMTFGILIKSKDNTLKVHNKIFEIRIYNYLIAKREKLEGELVTYEYRTQFVKDSKLDMELVLSKFQEIMYDEFREKDEKFIEREGRLLFLCFLKPIINGKGFYYVEPETRMDNRMDIVVTYGEEEFIIELKIWHGKNYKKDSIEQLSGYLEAKRKDIGYLISFNFNKNKEYTKEWIRHNGKNILDVVI